MFDVYGSQIRYEGVDVATLNKDVSPTLMHQFIVDLHEAIVNAEMECARCDTVEGPMDVICEACQKAAEQDAADEAKVKAYDEGYKDAAKVHEEAARKEHYTKPST